MLLMSSTLERRWMRPRFLGALVAALLWLPAVLLLLPTGDSRGQAFSLAGLVVSPLVGALLTPRAMASRGLGASTAVLFAVMSVAAGALLFGLLFAILEGLDPLNALGFGLVGLLFLGIPMLIGGTNLAMVWVALVCRLAYPQVG